MGHMQTFDTHNDSLLYLDLYVLGDGALISSVGVFHANQISMFLDPHLI